MKKVIVFMVTNGAGLGHLTRGLAVAKKLRQLDSNFEIVFFTTSLATEVIRNMGFMFYYIPTKTLMPETVTPSIWNEYLKYQLQQVIDFYNPVAIVFDGAYPYLGMISNLRQYKTLKSIWIKREGYKKNTSNLQELEKNFNLVIIPKDYTEASDETYRRKYCNAIVLLDSKEAHSRETIRAALGLGPNNHLFYVQLGAGNINDINEQYEVSIRCILKNPNNRILLAESIIGETIPIEDERIRTIRSYPNSQYFKAIDFAVSAVGYNTFHELLYFKVPSLFIPNMNTLKDDQLTRAQLAQEKGAALCLESVSEDRMDKALFYLVSEKEKMKQNLQKIHQENGAGEAARYILTEISK